MVQLRQVYLVPLIILVEHLHDVGDWVPGWNEAGPKLDERLNLSTTVSTVFWYEGVVDRA